MKKFAVRVLYAIARPAPYPGDDAPWWRRLLWALAGGAPGRK
jgi:hypothetical protein